MRVALVVFRPQPREEKPVVILSLIALWLLPILVSVARFVAARLLPLLAKTITMEIPLAYVVGVLLVTQVVGIVIAVLVYQHLETFTCFPATLVFVVHAIVPAISIALGTRDLLKGCEAPFFALLSLYNLGSGYLRWAADLRSDAAFEQRKEPIAARGLEWVKRFRQSVWVLLVLDFVAEELLGRVCRLHSLRLLGPPLADQHTTLAEYRTLSFAAGLVAAWSQATVLELLQRRMVLLQMLGARKTLFAGLSLLLMGAFAVAQQVQT